MGKQWKQWQTLFSWAPKSLPTVIAAMKLKDACSLGKKVMTNLDSILKSWHIIFLTNVCLVKAMAFPVVMYGCESWTIKKAEHQRIDAFELWYWRRLFESPLDCKKIQSVHPKGNQSWMLTGRTDVVAETPIDWPPDVKNWLTGKVPDAGKDWKQEVKRTTEDEMVGWHYRLNGHVMCLSKLWELVMDTGAWNGALHGVTKRWTRLRDWTELYNKNNNTYSICIF